MPNKPAAKKVSVDGVSYMAFDLTGANQLDTYANQAKANTEALKSLSVAHNQTINQYNLMVDIAKQQEARANQNYVNYQNAVEEHDNDKKWWAVEKVFWQALAIIGLAL